MARDPKSWNDVSSDRGTSVADGRECLAPFPEGPAGAPQMDDQARGELQNLSGGIGNIVPESGGAHKPSEEETAERDRARRANKIYRQVCNDRRMTPCFFNNFRTWSDYVKGKISDTEFYEQSENAAQKMAENAESH